ncbi:hypothetical protein [Streptomyces collinus]|uniref:hypothetical protein n=1 Tax=Streptomyces collinus TaxID=42684 RepID=UPI003403F497
MSFSPQRPGTAPSDLSGAVAEDLALYREKFRRRLPQSLEELHGPIEGVVMWPVLRTLVGRTVRSVWEEAFPELAVRVRAAA